MNEHATARVVKILCRILKIDYTLLPSIHNKALEFIISPSIRTLQRVVNSLMGGEYTLSPAQQIDFNKLLQEYTIINTQSSVEQIKQELEERSFVVEKSAEKTRADATQAILEERGSRYGKFKDHAHITQVFMNNSKVFLKEIHNTSLENKLSRSQREALHMIFHKIGRILNGDPNYADSWADIAGYARLVADELEGKIQ